ncbi:MAG TPA: methylmalonyl Co-A mutase-associated GTPase MeaB [Candidatus Eisenbacteria bacterium]|jgi:LAO/AO transport system kinase
MPDLAPPDAAPEDLIQRTLAGERVPLARALSWVENEHPHAIALLDACFARAGRAYRLGITGPPGAGKSTLVTKLALEYRARGLTVAVVAVDPTSPFSGGALLGDRVRMHELSGDEGVFIRSMATRGSMGGLAVHTTQVCDVLDAAGFDRVLIETVGVGQSELEVAETADTTAVVLVPESGDAVQMMKAGLMEIADVFVINKADREGADRAAQAIRSALHLRAKTSEWQIPVQLTSASLGKGVGELLERFEQHLAWLTASGTLERRRRRRLAQRLEGLVRERLWRRFQNGIPAGAWERAVAELGERSETPNGLAARLVEGADGADER